MRVSEQFSSRATSGPLLLKRRAGEKSNGDDTSTRSTARAEAHMLPTDESAPSAKRRATLDAFLERRKQVSEPTSSRVNTTVPDICSSIQAVRAGVPLPPKIKAQLLSRYFNTYAQVGWYGGPPQDSTTSLSLDARGENIVSGSALGVLSVHRVEDLRAARTVGHCQAPPEEWWEPTEAKPLTVAPWCGKVIDVKWSPGHAGCCAALSSMRQELFMFDMKSSRPSVTEFAVTTRRNDSAHNTLNQLCFFEGRGNNMAAGGYGEAYVWDTRAGKKPKLVVKCHDSRWTAGRGIKTIQVAQADQLLLAGTESGHVLIWDMRGGGGMGGSMFTPRGPRDERLLGALSIAEAFRKQNRLTAETFVPCQIPVSSLLLDPCNPTCVAFHTERGWSGVLDLATRDLVYMHCPPDAKEQRYWPHWLPRRPTWCAQGRGFCVGHGSGHVLALDFRSRSCSPCTVDNTEGQRPTASLIPVSQPVTALATHSQTDELIGGTWGGGLVLLSPGQNFPDTALSKNAVFEDGVEFLQET